MGSFNFRRFLNFYNGILNKHKYPVQIVTGGALWFTGDLLAQSLVHVAETYGGNDEEGKRKKPPLEVDWKRVGTMTCYGLFISAPVYAFWYSYLDRWSHRFFSSRKLPAASDAIIIPGKIRHFLQRFPRIGTALIPPLMAIVHRIPEPPTRRVWEIIGFKLAADCLLFDPAYLALFFTATNAFEGQSPAQIVKKLRQDLLPTYLVDIAVWLPIQTINFRWIPVVYQALFVQSCNVGWNAYLSFVQHKNNNNDDDNKE